MTYDQNHRLKQWQPAKRPDWVQRLNEEGACLDIKSVVPIDENSLIACAKRNTGLSDFGADDWHEPFNILVKGIDAEADLNLTGRLMTRSELLLLLEARLRVEDTYKRHPEIEDQELSTPCLILGSGRSGTSAMLNLLAMDPDNGTPLTWESMFPAPPPEAASYRNDPRIALAENHALRLSRVVPEVLGMHEYGAMIPMELNYLEMMSFQSIARLDLLGPSSTFQAYMAQRSQVPALDYAKRVLKLLQWKNPRKRWILKNPDALRFLPESFKVFPEAEIIWMHRDPFKTMSSVINLLGSYAWARSDKPLDGKTKEQITNPAGLARMFDKAIDQIEQGVIPAKRVHHVQYLDFVGDPLASVKSLYRSMGIEMSEKASAAMETYMREHPREKRPANKYEVDTTHISEERKLFERYQAAFEIKSEV